MIINTAGEYTLQYTATDACGNSTTVERDLVVEAPPRTVLYTDGTFIINELGQDQAANTALHGQPTNVYAPFDPNGATNIDKYIFSDDTSRPWNDQRFSIKSVEIGSVIRPTSTAHWFRGFIKCERMNLEGLDTSAVTDMTSMFNGMSQSTSPIISLDLSTFDTSAVTTMNRMFAYNTHIDKIYASDNFAVSQVTSSADMFYGMSNTLVGGAGTTWSNSNPKDKTYARIDNPPSAPGYFTAKS